MGISVESRIHRTLRRLSRFKSHKQGNQLPQLVDAPLPFENTEQLLGVYENNVDSKDGLLLFTNLGVYLCKDGRWQVLKYVDIEGCDWPAEGKTEAHTLVVKKKGGELMRLPVTGATEHGRDLFGVMRFIDRVASDVKS